MNEISTLKETSYDGTKAYKLKEITEIRQVIEKTLAGKDALAGFYAISDYLIWLINESNLILAPAYKEAHDALKNTLGYLDEIINMLPDEPTKEQA